MKKINLALLSLFALILAGAYVFYHKANISLETSPVERLSTLECDTVRKQELIDYFSKTYSKGIREKISLTSENSMGDIELVNNKLGPIKFESYKNNFKINTIEILRNTIFLQEYAYYNSDRIIRRDKLADALVMNKYADIFIINLEHNDRYIIFFLPYAMTNYSGCGTFIVVLLESNNQTQLIETIYTQNIFQTTDSTTFYYSIDNNNHLILPIWAEVENNDLKCGNYSLLLFEYDINGRLIFKNDLMQLCSSDTRINWQQRDMFCRY
jgi:hypothetical protein